MAFQSIVPQIAMMVASNNMHSTIMRGYKSHSTGSCRQTSYNNGYGENNRVVVKNHIVVSKEENEIVQRAKKILGD